MSNKLIRKILLHLLKNSTPLNETELIEQMKLFDELNNNKETLV